MSARDLLPTFLVAGTVLSCTTSSSVPSYYAVPEDAPNPIRIEFEGASVDEIVALAAKVCSDVAITTRQVDPRRGYVETAWVDIAAYRRLESQGYPLRERQVSYRFQAQARAEDAGTVELATYYQPNRPSGTSPAANARFDRLVPTGHPAYQLLLELGFRLREEMTEAGVPITERMDRE
jgi:hypothetical protein